MTVPEPFYGTDMPEANDVVLPNLIYTWAATDPQREFVIFEHTEPWTYADARDKMDATASALADLGIRKGDPVLVWWGMGEQLTQIFLGVVRLGAVFVPINTALRFESLAHIIAASGAKTLIASADAVTHIANAGVSELTTVITDDPDAWSDIDLRAESAEQLTAPGANAYDHEKLEPWDVHSVVFTSGTTGLAKGVTCTHLHTMTTASLSLHFLREDDRYLIASPFCHLAGIYSFWTVARLGASVALIDRFRTQDYWEKIESTHSTVSLLMGAMSNFLLKADESEHERSHGLRAVLQQPLAADAPEFARRFGVEVYTQYDMSELPPMIIGDVITGETAVEDGYCGRARASADIRLVDENDCEVADGEAGELIARSPVPWVISPGYWNAPETTAKTWRNGWFHTGDRLRRTPEGDYYFVSRVSDTIRRRGVSISASDIEAALTRVAEVDSAAVIPVSSEHGEDDVMVFVQVKAGERLTEPGVIDAVRERLAHFMVPRFVRMIDEIPRTESGKFAKARLRELAEESRGWDREAAGVVLKRPSGRA